MKKIIFIFLGLLISIQVCFAAPVIMGIELELQGITYENLSGIIVVDHIRLFESKKMSSTKEPNWYLEVDGSGNIEFVSRPMDLATEKDLLVDSLKEMCVLMRFLLAESVLVTKDPNDLHFLFESKKDLAFKEVGTFVHWQPLPKGAIKNIGQNIQIKISDPFCFVRPQTTFQLPLSSVQDFAYYMATGHKYLSTAIKEINKIFSNTLKDNTHGTGLACLVMITSELLRNNHSKGELGPKGVLTLMSRISFSKMYEALDQKEKETYNKIIDKYVSFHSNEVLFNKPYTLFCSGEDITKDEHGKLTEIGNNINKITIEDFLKSIINPTSPANKDLFNVSKNLLKSTLLQKKQEESILEILQNIKDGLFDFQSTDLLSPPPFLPYTYSLGKYKDISPDTAIIEMRGYTAQYGNKMKLGQLTLAWIQREIENATKIWEKNDILSLSSYQKKIKPIEESYEQLKEIIKGESIVEILGWFNSGQFIFKKLITVSKMVYNDFFSVFKQTKELFSKELELNKSVYQIQLLEEKKKFMVEFLGKEDI